MMADTTVTALSPSLPPVLEYITYRARQQVPPSRSQPRLKEGLSRCRPSRQGVLPVRALAYHSRCILASCSGWRLVYFLKVVQDLAHVH